MQKHQVGKVVKEADSFLRSIARNPYAVDALFAAFVFCVVMTDNNENSIQKSQGVQLAVAAAMLQMTLFLLRLTGASVTKAEEAGHADAAGAQQAAKPVSTNHHAGAANKRPIISSAEGGSSRAGSGSGASVAVGAAQAGSSRPASTSSCLGRRMVFSAGAVEASSAQQGIGSSAPVLRAVPQPTYRDDPELIARENAYMDEMNKKLEDAQDAIDAIDEELKRSLQLARVSAPTEATGTSAKNVRLAIIRNQEAKKNDLVEARNKLVKEYKNGLQALQASLVKEFAARTKSAASGKSGAAAAANDSDSALGGLPPETEKKKENTLGENEMPKPKKNTKSLKSDAQGSGPVAAAASAPGSQVPGSVAAAAPTPATQADATAIAASVDATATTAAATTTAPGSQASGTVVAAAPTPATQADATAIAASVDATATASAPGSRAPGTVVAATPADATGVSDEELAKFIDGDSAGDGFGDAEVTVEDLEKLEASAAAAASLLAAAGEGGEAPVVSATATAGAAAPVSTSAAPAPSSQVSGPATATETAGAAAPGSTPAAPAPSSQVSGPATATAVATGVSDEDPRAAEARRLAEVAAAEAAAESKREDAEKAFERGKLEVLAALEKDRLEIQATYEACEKLRDSKVYLKDSSVYVKQAEEKLAERPSVEISDLPALLASMNTQLEGYKKEQGKAITGHEKLAAMRAVIKRRLGTLGDAQKEKAVELDKHLSGKSVVEVVEAFVSRVRGLEQYKTIQDDTVVKQELKKHLTAYLKMHGIAVALEAKKIVAVMHLQREAQKRAEEAFNQAVGSIDTAVLDVEAAVAELGLDDIRAEAIRAAEERLSKLNAGVEAVEPKVELARRAGADHKGVDYDKVFREVGKAAAIVCAGATELKGEFDGFGRELAKMQAEAKAAAERVQRALDGFGDISARVENATTALQAAHKQLAERKSALEAEAKAEAKAEAEAAKAAAAKEAAAKEAEDARAEAEAEAAAAGAGAGAVPAKVEQGAGAGDTAAGADTVAGATALDPAATASQAVASGAGAGAGAGSPVDSDSDEGDIPDFLVRAAAGDGGSKSSYAGDGAGEESTGNAAVQYQSINNARDLLARLDSEKATASAELNDAKTDLARKEAGLKEATSALQEIELHQKQNEALIKTEEKVGSALKKAQEALEQFDKNLLSNLQELFKAKAASKASTGAGAGSGAAAGAGVGADADVATPKDYAFEDLDKIVSAYANMNNANAVLSVVKAKLKASRDRIKTEFGEESQNYKIQLAADQEQVLPIEQAATDAKQQLEKLVGNVDHFVESYPSVFLKRDKLAAAYAEKRDAAALVTAAIDAQSEITMNVDACQTQFEAAEAARDAAEEAVALKVEEIDGIAKNVASAERILYMLQRAQHMVESGVFTDEARKAKATQDLSDVKVEAPIEDAVLAAMRILHEISKSVIDVLKDAKQDWENFGQKDYTPEKPALGPNEKAGLNSKRSANSAGAAAPANGGSVGVAAGGSGAGADIEAKLDNYQDDLIVSVLVKLAERYRASSLLIDLREEGEEALLLNEHAVLVQAQQIYAQECARKADISKSRPLSESEAGYEADVVAELCAMLSGVNAYRQKHQVKTIALSKCSTLEDMSRIMHEVGNEDRLIPSRALRLIIQRGMKATERALAFLGLGAVKVKETNQKRRKVVVSAITTIHNEISRSLTALTRDIAALERAKAKAEAEAKAKAEAEAKAEVEAKAKAKAKATDAAGASVVAGAGADSVGASAGVGADFADASAIVGAGFAGASADGAGVASAVVGAGVGADFADASAIVGAGFAGASAAGAGVASAVVGAGVGADFAGASAIDGTVAPASMSDEGLVQWAFRALREKNRDGSPAAMPGLDQFSSPVAAIAFYQRFARRVDADAIATIQQLCAENDSLRSQHFQRGGSAHAYAGAGFGAQDIAALRSARGRMFGAVGGGSGGMGDGYPRGVVPGVAALEATVSAASVAPFDPRVGAGRGDAFARGRHPGLVGGGFGRPVAPMSSQSQAGVGAGDVALGKTGNGRG